MDSLKEKIQYILSKENYTFKQLADYLNLSEEQLETGLTQKTLELRYLEEISKNLKVPLYSFFRESDSQINYSEKPHYIHKLWAEEETTDSKKLIAEINLLKETIVRKEAELSKLLK